MWPPNQLAQAPSFWACSDTLQPDLAWVSQWLIRTDHVTWPKHGHRNVIPSICVFSVFIDRDHSQQSLWNFNFTKSIINHFDFSNWLLFFMAPHVIESILYHVHPCSTSKAAKLKITNHKPLHHCCKIIKSCCSLLFLPLMPLVLLSCITSNVTWIWLFIKIKHCEHHEMSCWSTELKMDHWVHTFNLIK